VKKIISEEKDNYIDIKFGKNKKYAWRETNVYKKIKKHLKYRRWKHKKAKKPRNNNTIDPFVTFIFRIWSH